MTAKRTCKADGGKCSEPVKARDLCGMHLQRYYRTGSTDPRPLSETRICKVCNRAIPRKNFPEARKVCEWCWADYMLETFGPCQVIEDGHICGGVIKARKLCQKHYGRWLRNGTTELQLRSTRICTRCGSEFPRENFPAKESVCATCLPIVKQERNAKRLSRASGVKQSAEELRKLQESKCAICKIPEFEGTAGSRSLHLDHNPDTNLIRGLLCCNCNPGLGQFKDSPELLAAAIIYLARTDNKLPEAKVALKHLQEQINDLELSMFGQKLCRAGRISVISIGAAQPDLGSTKSTTEIRVYHARLTLTSKVIKNYYCRTE